MHLEGCNDFGMGTGEMLKRVRLHPRIIDRTVMNDFNTAVRQEEQMVGNMLMLARWDTSRADRELYKFLHTKLTVGLKATSVLTCQAGMGFELYRIINKKLDPNNSISEHTILADIRRLAFAKAKDLMETQKRVVQLVALCSEYCDKTGREVELSEKTFAVWMFMDEDSKEKALRKTLSRAMQLVDLSRSSATTLKPSAPKRTTGRLLQRMLKRRPRSRWTSARWRPRASVQRGSVHLLPPEVQASQELS